MKNTINKTTIAPYIEPIPYAQRQVVRATRKPNANGDRKGEMMKPMVQKLSCGWGRRGKCRLEENIRTIRAWRWNGYRSVTT